MNSAAFLLAINASIGVSFAVVFLALTWRSSVNLGRWCAAGFLAAAATVAIEALASVIPSVRVTSAASFSMLMLALTTITVGLTLHYRPRARIDWLFGLFLIAITLNALVIFNLRRGSWAQSLGYQGPFALMLAIATATVLVTSSRRIIDVTLAMVLSLSAVQFLTKGVLAALAGQGPGVRDYLVSTYAFYSQTAGGILSLLLGLALVGLVVREVMAEARLVLQRDTLSGLLNRAAFMERVAGLLRLSNRAPAALIIADLDHFKAINDRYGHAAGDEVIKAFGANLIAYFTGEELCGRIGGEEFCILVSNCGPEAARIHLNALQWLTQRNRYARLPGDIGVTASFGVAFADRNEPFEDAMHRADMALYEAKAMGRNGYRFASTRDESQPAPRERPRLGSAAAQPSGSD